MDIGQTINSWIQQNLIQPIIDAGRVLAAYILALLLIIAGIVLIAHSEASGGV